ncbi:MAG: MBL fold metallo-hydrolase [Armatimonadetes bacterium]|nr:MBL fold metallo-hydrolase [Armatimonadota bacterium]
MLIRYLGHNCFYLSNSTGISIIVDPYGEHLPYKFPSISSDIVLITHEHRDHNAKWRINGNPIIVKRTSDFLMEQEVSFKEKNEILIFKGIPSYHDNMAGRKFGPNTIFIWEMDALRICYLGDLGHLLSEEQKKIIGKVNILFIPAGGKTTLNSTEAALIINELRPNLIFPMHYKTQETAGLNLAEESLEEFLKKVENIEKPNSLAYETDKFRLPFSPTAIVLEYEKE